MKRRDLRNFPTVNEPCLDVSRVPNGEETLLTDKESIRKVWQLSTNALDMLREQNGSGIYDIFQRIIPEKHPLRSWVKVRGKLPMTPPYLPSLPSLPSTLDESSL